MKKFISLLLISALSFSLIACGNTTERIEPSAEPTVSSVEEVTETSTSDTETVSAESTVEETPSAYLKDVFAEHGLKVGTCLTAQMLSYPDQVELIKNNFTSATMENAMKPDSFLNYNKSKEVGEIVVEFNKDAKKMLDFAKENNIAMRGHTIIWYSQTPTWIFYEDFNNKKELVSREVMLDRMEKYIKNVFDYIKESDYADVFYAYDVVNEAWMEDGKLRENLWTKTIGDDYLWYAFYYADKYAPESIDLYYNDYNEQFKTETLYKFVNTLVDEDGRYLIDGIGLQAHLYTGDAIDSYFNMIDRLSSTGLKVQMTELDVCLGAWQKPKPGDDENFKTQGRYYYNLINGIFERVDAGTLNMDAVTFWGYLDKSSWRREYSPCLFTGNLVPKYAYYGALQEHDLAGF